MSEVTDEDGMTKRPAERLAPTRGFWWIEREEDDDEERERGDQEAQAEDAARG